MNAPELEILSWVEDLTPAQGKLVLELCQKEESCGPASWIIEQLCSGHMGCWASPEGLVLTQINTSTFGRELFVYGLAGRGMIAAADQICADLKTIARVFECSSIGGVVNRPGLKRLYDVLGAKPVSVCYRLEID